MRYNDFLWILALLCLSCMALIGLIGCDNGDGNGTTTPTIDYSFMMGISPNYTLLGCPDYKQQIDLVSQHKGNMLRFFGYAGWGDCPGSYVYKPCIGNDLSQIDPNYIQRVKDVVGYATSKGIITIFSLFHNNGDPYAWIAHTDGVKQRAYIQAVYNATKGMAIIFEPLNEDVDQNFDEFVRNELQVLDPNVKTCFYNANGGTYRIEHVLSKGYIGGGKIHSNDRSGYPQYYNSGDYYNVSYSAKQQGGHVEWLLFWDKGNGSLPTVADIEREYGQTLDLLSTVR